MSDIIGKFLFIMLLIVFLSGVAFCSMGVAFVGCRAVTDKTVTQCADETFPWRKP